MSMYERILVATDGSELSDLAVQSAIDTGINPRLQRWVLIVCGS